MKKIITLLLMLVTVTAFAQTVTYQSLVSPTFDTTVAKITTISATIKYATLNQAVITLTNGGLPATINPASLTQATMTQGSTTVELSFKPYKKPVTPPVITPPVVTQPTGTTTIGKIVSGPVAIQSGKVYQDLIIDLGQTSSIAFTGNNVSGFTIKRCKIINGKVKDANTIAGAVLLNGCSNFTIDSCFITNIPQGIHLKSCTGPYNINDNQFLNVIGDPVTHLHCINIENCNGKGQHILNNTIEEISPIADNTHDQISIYNSNGIPGDSIMVTGTRMRGGQGKFSPGTTGGGSGACGIGFGDNGGSYQVVRGNILVDPGYIGIQAAGGSHLRADHNKIFSIAWGVSGAGMVWQNLTSTPSTDVIYSYNQIKFLNAQGGEVDFNNKGNCTSIGNIMPAKIDASILPATIITMK